MTKVLLRTPAKAEVTEATEWYSARSFETARRFIPMVDVTINRIAAAPDSFLRVGVRLRRAIFPHFPYAIYSVVLPDMTSVVGVIHTRRHPRRWLQRDDV